jgi:septal ring factor EnvC (AmiA/AmiB activator)
MDNSYYKGIINIKNILKKSLKDDTLDFDNVPEYLLEDNTSIDSEIVLADLFMAVVFLNTKVEDLEKKNRNLVKQISELRDETITASTKTLKNIQDIEKAKRDIDHIDNHIVALEANLRVLRHTLTYENDISENDLPKLKTCYLGGGDVGKL